MPSTRITYNNAITGGAVVWSLVNGLLEANETTIRIKNTLDNIAGTNPAVFANLEPVFGLTEGQGEAFYNTIASLKASLGDVCAGLVPLDKII